MTFQAMPPPELTTLLVSHGYKLFRAARGSFRPYLVSPTTVLGRELNPSSFLATRDPARAEERFRQPAWLALCRAL